MRCAKSGASVGTARGRIRVAVEATGPTGTSPLEKRAIAPPDPERTDTSGTASWPHKRYFNKRLNKRLMLYSPVMDSTAIVTALDALAHEHRLAVFRQLVQAGPEGLNAGTLSGRLQVSPSSLSFHLKDLVKADLIQPRHVGRQIFYSARFETMNGLIGYLTENCCGGNPCSPLRATDCSTEEESS
jgi:ArsR family transcriptional regulator